MAQTLLSQHAVHLLSVGIPVLMLGTGLVWDSVRTRRRSRPRADQPSFDRRRWSLRTAAAASGAAAVVHLTVLPQHAAESALYGAFFAGAAVAQLGGIWVLLAKNSRLLVTINAAGNAGIIALWLFTRLVSVPFGPGAGTVEGFGVFDVTAGIFETVVVLGCLAALRPARHRSLTAMDVGQTSRPVEVG